MQKTPWSSWILSNNSVGHRASKGPKSPLQHFCLRLAKKSRMAMGQICVPKMEPWQMEPKTKTCGPLVVLF